MHKVIKAADFEAMTRRAEAGQQATDQAAAILRKAEDQAARIRACAAKQGYTEGKAEAAAMLATARTRHAKALTLSEEDITSLSIGIAERILHREIRLDPDVIRGVVQEVLDLAADADRMILHVHPDDLTAAREAAARFRHPVSFEPDPAVARGGCVAMCDMGRVEATLGSMLQKIQDELAGVDPEAPKDDA